MNKSFRNILICCLLLTTYCLLSTPYCLLVYAYPPGWSDDILLSPDDPKHRCQPDLDVDGFNFVWAVWDTGSWVSGTAEILYSKRDSLGACLIPETAVSNNASYSLGPRIAVDASNNIQFVWLDQTPQGMGLWHATLASDGSVIVPAHLAVSGNNDGYPINIALNKHKEINVIWDEISSGNNQMNYTKLDSLGNPIITKIRVSPDSIYAHWSGIGTDSMANNHLGYGLAITSIESLTYTKLDKNGNVLIDNKILGSGLLPTIVADQNQNIHMAYGHQIPYVGWSIEYLKLDQDANILVGPKTLSIYQTNARAHMAMDSLQYLHVVWDSESGGAFPVMYTKLDTMGEFVIPPMQVVYPPYTSGAGIPRIAVDRSNRLHLVWVDERLNPGISTAIFYKRGENESTVEEIARLKTAKFPRITVSPNPFSKETRIHFVSSCKSKKIEFLVFDVTGSKVKEFLFSEHSRIVTWQGTDNTGNLLPAGVYFLRDVSSPSPKQSVQLILLR